MTDDIYQKLARHLDDLPGGFPSTESGVEMRILRRLFTPDEAELALHLTLIPEESRVIALRAKIDWEEADRRLWSPLLLRPWQIRRPVRVAEPAWTDARWRQ